MLKHAQPLLGPAPLLLPLGAGGAEGGGLIEEVITGQRLDKVLSLTLAGQPLHNQHGACLSRNKILKCMSRANLGLGWEGARRGGGGASRDRNRAGAGRWGGGRRVD